MGNENTIINTINNSHPPMQLASAPMSIYNQSFPASNIYAPVYQDLNTYTNVPLG